MTTTTSLRFSFNSRIDIRPISDEFFAELTRINEIQNIRNTDPLIYDQFYLYSEEIFNVVSKVFILGHMWADIT